ncbi:MAG: family 16 glycosylhydrolase [Clostridiales bacterium]|nr:family 16 glycosylhydrolase [Clostridiales bacterium]
MKKKAISVTLASVFAMSFCGGALVGCGGGDDPEQKLPTLTDEALKVTKVADYTTGQASDRSGVFASAGFENGDVFNTWWSADNVSFDNNLAQLSISEMTEKEQKWDAETEAFVDCQADYYGGELRTTNYYGYGDYEVSMKPAKIAGTASTFFVCTGPYDVNYETGVPNKHDEIDIEFLGYDTTFVQFNYFVDGKGGHEFKYKLGFDASKEFHTYGFRWAEDYIVWFVDGKPVYKVSKSSKNPMPSTPGRILTNYWTGTKASENWMKPFPNDYSGKAEYKYIASSATPLDDPTVAPPAPPEEVEVPESGWTDIDTSGFGGWGMYTVEHHDDGISMKHESAFTTNSYKCEGMSLASNYSWVKFHIKNNSEEAAAVRVDIKKENPSAGGVAAVVSEHEGVSHIAAESAVSIKLAAGEEADVACKIKDTVTINQFVVFLNSMDAPNAAKGDITISALKGIPAEAGEDPELPPEGDGGVKIGESEVAFSGNGYSVSYAEDKSAMTVAYAELGGNSYNNIVADITNIIGDNNVFNFTIKNNNETDALVRIDIKCPLGAVYDVANGTYSNLKGTFTGDVVSSGEDYQYGGADKVVIKAGGTVTGKIVFDAAVANSQVAFFIESSDWQDDGTHTGSVTISGMSFTKEESQEPGPEEPGDEVWTPIDFSSGVSKNDDADNIYSYTATENSITITHSTKPKASSSVFKDVAYNGNNKIRMNIKNNLDSAYKMRVNVQSASAGYKTVILKATVDGQPITVPAGDNWDGVTVELAANADIVFECVINPDGAVNLAFGVNNMADGAEAGNVTISDICMTGAVPEEMDLPEGDGWTGINLKGSGVYHKDQGNRYTLEENANSINIKHSELPVTEGNINHAVDYGDNNLVHLEITNNGDVTALIALWVQNSSYANVIDESSITITGEAGDYTLNGNTVTVEAGKTIIVEFKINAGGTNICFGVNNTAESASTGDITISKVAMKKAE